MVDASHLLQVLHLLQVSAEYVGGGGHGFDGGVTCFFGRFACLLSGLPRFLRRGTRLFALLPHLLEFFAMLSVILSCLSGESRVLFSVPPSRFIRHAAFLREPAVFFAHLTL